MKKHLVLITVMFFVISLSHAQIVLYPPCAVGSVQTFTPCTNTSSHIDTTSRFLVGEYYGWFYGGDIWFTCGILEFNAQATFCGGILPVPGMTEFNWTARLNSLVATYVENPGVWMHCNLYGLQDIEEDCELNENDMWKPAEYITELFDHAPELPVTFTNIDVTEALRRDLFGEAPANASTAFYLSPERDFYPQGNEHEVRFDKQRPYIAINILNSGSPTVTMPPITSPTQTPWPTATPIFTLPPPSTATPHDWPTWTPGPPVTPTFSPTPENLSLGVHLIMPTQHFHPGDTFWVEVDLQNPGFSRDRINVFVILDVEGHYFFWPEWSQPPAVCYSATDLPNGKTHIRIIDPFIWPKDSGAADHVRFWAAMTDEESSRIIGEYDVLEFSWESGA